jgi:predicted HAD superfamily Cof-like phosphohydrolase
MEQFNPIKQVTEFHLAFDYPVVSSPAIPDAKRCELRYNLLAEEVKEMKIAAEHGDIVGVADALCDIQYVLAGAILEFGLAEKFPALFNEVQRSNMSKACSTMEEAQATCDHWTTEGNDACHIVSKNDKYLVYRTRDGKTMKNVNYSPANLEKLI